MIVVSLIQYSYSNTELYFHPVSLASSLVINSSIKSSFIYLKFSSTTDALNINDLCFDVSYRKLSGYGEPILFSDGPYYYSKEHYVFGFGKRISINKSLYIKPLYNYGVSNVGNEKNSLHELMMYIGYLNEGEQVIFLIDLGLGYQLYKNDQFINVNRFSIDPNLGIGIKF